MIDIAKLLCSLLSQIEGHRGEPINKGNIQEALREQNYEVVNGELVKVKLDNNPKLLKDHWYRPIITIDELGIDKDDVLYCPQDNYLNKNDGSHLLSSELSKWLEFFDEVPDRKFKIGDYVKSPATSSLVKVDQINYDSYRVLDEQTGKEYIIPMTDEDQLKLWKISDCSPGDFLSVTLENNQRYILIYHQIENDQIKSYAHWAVGVQVFPMGGIVATVCDRITIRLATKEEYYEFMSELSKTGYRWDSDQQKIVSIYSTKFKVGDTICHPENRIVRHVIEKVDLLHGYYRCTDGFVLEIKAADEKYIIPDPSERLSDLDLILGWFAHIEQLATDRKTQNGYVMTPQDALDEIKVLAKDSQEYIKTHVAPEKIIFRQADVDRMVSKFRTEPLTDEVLMMLRKN